MMNDKWRYPVLLVKQNRLCISYYYFAKLHHFDKIVRHRGSKNAIKYNVFRKKKIKKYCRAPMYIAKYFQNVVSKAPTKLLQ